MRRRYPDPSERHLRCRSSLMPVWHPIFRGFCTSRRLNCSWPFILTIAAMLPVASPRLRVGRARHSCQSVQSCKRRCCMAMIDSCCSTIIHPEIRSEEHTSELQSLMRNSYAVLCLNKKKEIQKLKQISYQDL